MSDSVFGELKVNNPRLKERRKSLTVTCRVVKSRKVSRFMSTLGTPGLEEFVTGGRTDGTGGVLSSSEVVPTPMTFDYAIIRILMQDSDARAYLVYLWVL